MNKRLGSLLLCCMMGSAFAQTTYLPLNTEEYHLLDRLETINGSLNSDFQASFKPISRKAAVDFLVKERRYGNVPGNTINDIDYYDIERAISISGEWSTTAEGYDGSIDAKRPVLKYFYQKQSDMVHVNTGDFYLVVNPVIYAMAMKENNDDGFKFINTRGVEFRGRILNRIGFYSMFADNQEKSPGFANSWANQYQAFPGNDYYTTPNNGFDNLIARGYIDFDALQSHLNVTFGYDKQFSGDGIRSLFHSDFGAPATFLRLRSSFWKLNYESLMLELVPDYLRGGDQHLPHNYATMNQVSMNVLPWLNIGLFESTLFSGTDCIQIQNAVPVIFYNTLARSLGANQKTSLGLNFKMLAANRLQFYGQGYFDQIKLDRLTDGWYGNQFGVQLGVKYFNAFTIPNLDMQLEANYVRPYTYASNDALTNYTNYNQPLAHPYGAGFSELIANIRYQPFNKLYLSLKGIMANRGDDPAVNPYSMGNNIMKPIDARTMEDGIGVTGSGLTYKKFYINPNAAYELRPNLFLEAGAYYQKGFYENGVDIAPNSFTFYGGFRLNIARKEYDGF